MGYTLWSLWLKDQYLYFNSWEKAGMQESKDASERILQLRTAVLHCNHIETVQPKSSEMTVKVSFTLFWIANVLFSWKPSKEQLDMLFFNIYTSWIFFKVYITLLCSLSGWSTTICTHMHTHILVPVFFCGLTELLTLNISTNLLTLSLT